PPPCLADDDSLLLSGNRRRTRARVAVTPGVTVAPRIPVAPGVPIAPRIAIAPRVSITPGIAGSLGVGAIPQQSFTDQGNAHQEASGQRNTVQGADQTTHQRIAGRGHDVVVAVGVPVGAAAEVLEAGQIRPNIE